MEKILTSSCEANACWNPANKDHWQSDYKPELPGFGNINLFLHCSRLCILCERWHDEFSVQMFSVLYLSAKDWAYISYSYVWLQNECKKCSDLMGYMLFLLLLMERTKLMLSLPKFGFIM